MATWDPENNEDRFKRSLGTKIAGERNETESDGTDYQSVVQEATYTVIAAATIAADTITTVSATPAILYGYNVPTTAIATAAIQFKDDTTLVASTLVDHAIGATVMFNPGIRFETSLKVDPQGTSAGDMTVFWREI